MQAGKCAYGEVDGQRVKCTYDRCCSRISMIGPSSDKGEIRSQRRTLTLYASEEAFLQKAFTFTLMPCSLRLFSSTETQLHMAAPMLHYSKLAAYGMQPGYSAQASSQFTLLPGSHRLGTRMKA